MSARAFAVATRCGDLDIAALVRGGRLSDLRLDDAASRDPRPGEIWAASVERLAPRQGAAFLSLGDAPAFLPNAEGLSPGDRVLVEIQRPAEGGKAAAANRKLTWRGRLMAHTPSAPGVNVSRRIDDPAEQQRLRGVLAPVAETGGFVLRTAAAGADPDALLGEARALAEAARSVLGDASPPPRRLRPAPAPLDQIRWDWSDAEPRDDDALFETLDLFAQIDALLASDVALDHGWMRLDRTEALVAIDVNTGVGGGALSINLAAADEIPRQLRLRGWGGMILMDFAGRAESDRPRIESRLRAAADGAFKPAGWGPLGLLEARRRRDRAAIETLWPPSRETEAR